MPRRLRAEVLLIVSICLSVSLCSAQKRSVDAEGHQWWQNAVFYEIYPRSFADSNGDGIGDLKGIDSKLNYLRDLGIDAIWISPCYPSPQVDFGYDVSDYEDIDPMYGTLKDFEHLSHDAKKHDIRIIMDFVLNHSSTQHKWFIDSASSRTSAHRDWYIWRDGKAPGVPPNNWISGFGGSAWQFDSKTGQYYYHFFAVGQADLNWRNPAVETAMFDVTRFWYKRGVSGFRLDAVDLLFEDPNLHDNPVLEGTNELGDPNMQNKYNDKLPEVHVELKKLRRVADENNAVLIGETYTSNRDELKEYYGDHNDEIQMPMDFMFCTVDKLSPADFRAQIANAESTGGWPVYVISNHDMTRSYNRYGDGKHNDQIAKLMAGMYLTLRGTPIMYYGEELGMENNDPVRKEDVKDPIGIAGWPKEKGRDGERTPMQWNDSPYAGFSPTRPWLPVPASFKTHNVDSELADPNSILQFYKRLLALRHHEPALLYGDYVALNQDNPNVLSYLRRYKNEAVLVVLNMSATAQQINFNLSEQGISSAKATTLLTSSANASSGQLDQVTLEPFEVYIARVSQ
ncbi:MAG TPA: alpha-glucosidase [Terriglobales bacterium]|jgi:alpha-glucosidase|nr:alpha-glucosidase [Terriglobales bacterium]